MSNSKKQSAFPFERKNPQRNIHSDSYESEKGMDLRDYFAAKAMQAIITTKLTDADFAIGTNNIKTNEIVSKVSYSIADAMLKEREKQNNN